MLGCCTFTSFMFGLIVGCSSLPLSTTPWLKLNASHKVWWYNSSPVRCAVSPSAACLGPFLLHHIRSFQPIHKDGYPMIDVVWCCYHHLLPNILDDPSFSHPRYFHLGANQIPTSLSSPYIIIECPIAQRAVLFASSPFHSAVSVGYPAIPRPVNRVGTSPIIRYFIF